MGFQYYPTVLFTTPCTAAYVLNPLTSCSLELTIQQYSNLPNALLSFVAGPVLISEFLADPGPTDLRAPGSLEPSEWIELVNNGTAPVNLSGWVLSDNKDIAEGWTMPSKVLGPGEYQLIYLTSERNS